MRFWPAGPRNSLDISSDGIVCRCHDYGRICRGDRRLRTGRNPYFDHHGPSPILWVSFMYPFGHGLWWLDPVERCGRSAGNGTLARVTRRLGPGDRRRGESWLRVLPVREQPPLPDAAGLARVVESTRGDATSSASRSRSSRADNRSCLRASRVLVRPPSLTSTVPSEPADGRNGEDPYTGVTASSAIPPIGSEHPHRPSYLR